MAQTLAELRTAFTEKDTAREALLAKDTLTAEDVTSAEALIGEMEGIRGQIEQSQKVDSLRTRGSAASQWASATPGVRHGGTPAVAGDQLQTPLGWQSGKLSPNGVTVLGMNPSGFVDLNGLKNRGIEITNAVDPAFGKEAFKNSGTPDYKTAYRKMMTLGWHALSNSDQFTLQEGVDSLGGFLVPEDMRAEILDRKPTPTRVAGRVTQIDTMRDAVVYPRVIYTTDDLYTTGMRITWTGELPATATGHRVTEPVFGTVRIPIYTAMMSIPVSRDLLEDAMFDLEAWLTGKFSETVDLLKDNMILNGSGIGQPMGILANPTGSGQPAIINSGAASALTGDGLINLTESLPEQYDEDAVLVFNKTNTGKAIRLLKDGDGRPLVSYGAGDFGLASGRPKEINGYPFIWSGFMPNVGTNTYPIAFGDLKGYILANRVSFSLQVLRELYAETNLVLLLGRVRFGGAVAEGYRLRLHKVAA